ncbi:hypothetical protein CC86DRAFT_407683 [Ophiobolus disseminans]|uniref:Uncharacterized protein n=1 Tax=Ophiobolus disseminans TaxID=1469910 RepID=A0A6A6ZX87_9PLEO|nr:hypothetical protein CC86DRAFT_407683 [Ophiobolus disseminans]
MDSTTASTSGTTSDEMWPVLIHIVPSANRRPHQPNVQYVPAHHVSQIRKEMLEGMFNPHGVIKLERCLDPATGKQLSKLYLATFPDFDSVHAAKRAWNAVQLEENPFIAMVILDNIEEDTTMLKLLQTSTTVAHDHNASNRIIPHRTPSMLATIFKE